MNRRSLLKGAAMATAVAAARPTLAADTATLRVGYLHGLASDGHLWTAELLGSFEQQGLEIETIQFVTGLEAYQALAGGSIDLVTTGAVISNFPARGQGKAFLINDEEFGTAQLWVHPASGIKSVADLKGQKIATTRGTTAHYFLFRALRHNGLDPTKDIEIVHQQMGNAVTAFIAGAVPAVATWMPFDSSIAKSAPDAVRIADSSQFADASVLNGWSARNELHASDADQLRRIVRAWLPANEALVTRPQEILTTLQPTRYREFTLAQLQSQYDACHWRPAADWAARFSVGSVTQILDQVTAFNVAVGAFTDPLPAATYFDPSPLQDVLAQG
jgi:NitT/TauT family transport system substrate-binding protein